MSHDMPKDLSKRCHKFSCLVHKIGFGVAAMSEFLLEHPAHCSVFTELYLDYKSGGEICMIVAEVVVEGSFRYIKARKLQHLFG